MIDPTKFDFETNRTVYSECLGDLCPNLEVKFVKECLKKNFTVFYVNVNKSAINTRENFLGSPNIQKLFLIDTVSKIPANDIDDNLVYLKNGESMCKLQIKIMDLWKKTDGKKILFFDCAEYLPILFDKTQLAQFTNKMARELQNGIVFFSFLKNSLDPKDELIIKHLFDEVIEM